MPSSEFDAWWERFSSTGDICPVKLGFSRDEVRRVLGEPDDVGGTSRKHRRPRIWRYRDLEFHFSGDGLSLIYQETPSGIVRISIPLQAEGAA